MFVPLRDNGDLHGLDGFHFMKSVGGLAPLCLGKNVKRLIVRLINMMVKGYLESAPMFANTLTWLTC